jgi:hypothetical protein
VTSPASTAAALPAAAGGLGSRSNPYTGASVYALPNWEVVVLERVRGAEAAAVVQRPAPPGQEYLLLKLRLAWRGSGRAPSLHFELTGDRLLRYLSDSGAPGTPSPDLYLALAGQSQGEGWVKFVIGQGEQGLQLILQEASSAGLAWTFLALDDGARYAADPALAQIVPTSLGADTDSPAPLGSTVTNDRWEVTVLEVTGGEAALAAIQAQAAAGSPPPDPGMTYFLARVRVRYIGQSDAFGDTVLRDYLNFRMTGASEDDYVYPPLTTPAPSFTGGIWFFPGAAYEAWVIGQTPQGEARPQLVFFSLLEDEETTRYLALTP